LPASPIAFSSHLYATQQTKPEKGPSLTSRSLSHQANVMLSYPIPEAEELLANKLSAAQQSLSNCEEDMDFLREQVTVRYILPFLLTHISSSPLISALFILHSLSPLFPGVYSQTARQN
jgi:hypothetical protein